MPRRFSCHRWWNVDCTKTRKEKKKFKHKTFAKIWLESNECLVTLKRKHFLWTSSRNHKLKRSVHDSPNPMRWGSWNNPLFVKRNDVVFVGESPELCKRPQMCKRALRRWINSLAFHTVRGFPRSHLVQRPTLQLNNYNNAQFLWSERKRNQLSTHLREYDNEFERFRSAD